MNKGGIKSLSTTIIFYASTLAFLLGVTLASFDGFFSRLSDLLMFAIALLCLVLFFVFNNNLKLKIVFFMAIFLFLGIWRFVITIPNLGPGEVAYYNEERHEISATIITDTVRIKNRQNFVVDAVIEDSDSTQKPKGKIIVYARAFPRYDYGDAVAMKCELKAPESFDGFDYGRYLAKDQIYSICYYPEIRIIDGRDAINRVSTPPIALIINFFMSKIYATRHMFAGIIDRGLSEPESGVARATILGEGKIIDKDLQQSFSYSGLSHIIAISGMHITVLAVMIYFVLFKFGLNRNQVFYSSLVFLFLFIVMAGAPPSAVRSGIMAGLAMFAIKIGRQNNFTRIIIFTAVLQLLINPRMLRDDIGFQLSFVSILGIVYLYPIMEMMLEKIKLTSKFKIRDVVAVTLAAQISTGGIIVYYFEMVSVFGIISNVLVIWTSGFILIFLIIAMLLGLVIGNYEEFFFFPVKIIIDYMYLVSDFVVALPFSHLNVELSFFGVWAYYLCVAIIVFVYNFKKKT